MSTRRFWPALAVITIAACSGQTPPPAVEPAPAVASQGPPAPQDSSATVETPEEFEQLVAPIALYPDELVAQVLTASSYPTEIVEADRWISQNPNLKGDSLAKAVDQQPWDPSVKALTQFPSVLANMDKNLSWTSALGEAYVNHEQDVMDAVQTMRQHAQQAGTLQSTPQENVSTQGQDIIIEPADPDVVYVPAYDPWTVYGPIIDAWPDWYVYPGLYIDTPGIAFGVGFGIGAFGGYGWGWHHWDDDWHHHHVNWDHHAYVSHSRTFINNRTRALNPSDFSTPRAGFTRSPQGSYATGSRVAPGAHANNGSRPSAFGGYNHGGVTRSYSSRGAASFHSSGGGFHGSPGGGFHGGGGHH